MKIIINGEAVEIGGEQAQDVYSTEEKRIGTWVDGKPLYRKVYIGGITITTTDKLDVQLESDSSFIDTFLGAFGSYSIYATDTNEWYGYTIPYQEVGFPSPNISKIKFAMVCNTLGSLWFTGSFWYSSDMKYQIVAYYTKTTDEPV